MPSFSRRALLQTATLTAAALPAARLDASSRPSFVDRLSACLWAMAIGDGMGAPVEGWDGARVRATYGNHDFTRFLPPTDPALVGTGKGKGDGRITDDMLLIEALIRAYEAHRDHLDAYDYVRFVIPEYAERKVWVPEKQDKRTALERPLWWPERYAYHRLVINNIDPRIGGQGNWPQQGFMGMVMPTGAVNAGDPQGAYDEVIAYGVATQHSYALEAGAVTAACFAAAFARDAKIDDITNAATRYAKDGTAEAIGAVLAEVDPGDSFERFASRTRKAFIPYFGLSPKTLSEDNPDTRKIAGSNVSSPSRIAAVENLTAGLAAHAYGQGDFLRTMKAALFYGEDNESIAAFALGLLSGRIGTSSLPRALVEASRRGNLRDYDAMAARFTATVKDVLAKDRARQRTREDAVS
jgi:ADP-ribosylglycohydrolase